MPIRLRKLIGIFALLVYMTLYCLAAMGVAGNYILGLSGWVQTLYFIIAGFAWLPPAMLLISWMQRPGAA